MATLLDKNSKTVLLKLTISEYKKISELGVLDYDSIDNYEFVFDKPIKASDLIKTF